MNELLCKLGVYIHYRAIRILIPLFKSLCSSVFALHCLCQYTTLDKDSNVATVPGH